MLEVTELNEAKDSIPRDFSAEEAIEEDFSSDDFDAYRDFDAEDSTSLDSDINYSSIPLDESYG